MTLFFFPSKLTRDFTSFADFALGTAVLTFGRLERQNIAHHVCVSLFPLRLPGAEMFFQVVVVNSKLA